MSIFHPTTKCGYCPQNYTRNFISGCSRYSEVVSDADIDCPYFVHDVQETAFGVTQIFEFRAEDWPAYLFEEVRTYRGEFIAHGDETYVDVAGALGVDEDACYGFGVDNDDFAMRRAIAFFERYCCTPPLPADIAPVHMLPHEREVFRMTASILKAVMPGDAAFWGIAATADNSDVPYGFTVL